MQQELSKEEIKKKLEEKKNGYIEENEKKHFDLEENIKEFYKFFKEEINEVIENLTDIGEIKLLAKDNIKFKFPKSITLNLLEKKIEEEKILEFIKLFYEENINNINKELMELNEEEKLIRYKKDFLKFEFPLHLSMEYLKKMK